MQINNNRYRYSSVGNEDYTIRITLIGNSNTGKTSLFNLLCHNLNSNTKDFLTPTIGVDFKSVDYEYDDIKFRLQYWDTAGVEKFRAITRSYYRNVYAIFLVFDLNNRKSFDDLRYWIHDISNDKVKYILIGNKSDLYHKVDKIDIKNFCKDHNILEYYDISVKNNLEQNENISYINNVILSNFLLNDMSAFDIHGVKQNIDGVKQNISYLDKHNISIKTKKCC